MYYHESAAQELNFDFDLEALQSPESVPYDIIFEYRYRSQEHGRCLITW